MLAFQSCADSVEVIQNNTTMVKDVGVVGQGTAYVNVDFSGVTGLSRQDAAEINGMLGTSIADALGPTFKQTRMSTDLARVEPESADLMLLLRAQNLRYPKQWSDITRPWSRLLLIAILAETYSIFALDFPSHRNDVVLPLSALAMVAYEFFYCDRFESTKGSYSLDYQLSLVKPDGTILSHRQFTDSAKVLVQADAGTRDLRLKELVSATKASIAGSIQNFIVADSASIRTLGAEMSRAFPADCDRILTYKRNVYHILDENPAQIGSGHSTN